MEISYRRTPPSLPERVLSRLVRRRPIPAAPVHRLDVVQDVDLEVMQA